MNKLLIICGSTATGKTDLGVALAKRYNGEIISADSRQVYRGMDIGTGKDIDSNSKIKNQNAKLHSLNEKFAVGFREKDGIPIWLVDIVEPDYVFNVGEYKQLAEIAIKDIRSRNKLPIVVGGTGLYIRSLLEPLDLIEIPPNSSLRQKLDTYSISELQEELRQLSPNRFQHMNGSDKKNPRRLVRAIEIEEWKKDREGLPTLGLRGGQGVLRKNTLIIGLTAPIEELFQRINFRVEERIKQGVIAEIKYLLSQGFSWELPSMSGLGYKEWQKYFQMGKPTTYNLQHTTDLWKLHERQYAKRQMTYFRKMKQIVWYDVTKPESKSDILDRVGKWYNQI